MSQNAERLTPTGRRVRRVANRRTNPIDVHTDTAPVGTEQALQRLTGRARTWRI